MWLTVSYRTRAPAPGVCLGAHFTHERSTPNFRTELRIFLGGGRREGPGTRQTGAAHAAAVSTPRTSERTAGGHAGATPVSAGRSASGNSSVSPTGESEIRK